MVRARYLAAVALLGVAGCQQQQPAAPAPDETAAAAPAVAGVERVEAKAEPAPAAAPVQEVIQTQPGPNGASAALNKVKVTGDVLTVQLTIAGESGSLGPPLDEISLIDDKTSQRIGMLKDNEGKWMASPIGIGGRSLHINLNQKSVIVWMKFPAPPATSPTVSLNIPEFAPFDGVPVSR